MQKSPTFAQRTLHLNTRALFLRKRALNSHKRAQFLQKLALCSPKTALHLPKSARYFLVALALWPACLLHIHAHTFLSRIFFSLSHLLWTLMPPSVSVCVCVCAHRMRVCKRLTGHRASAEGDLPFGCDRAARIQKFSKVSPLRKLLCKTDFPHF